MAKTEVVCVTFLLDFACQKLSKSANVSHSYSKNKWHAFMDHGVNWYNMIDWYVVLIYLQQMALYQCVLIESLLCQVNPYQSAYSSTAMTWHQQCETSTRNFLFATTWILFWLMRKTEDTSNNRCVNHSVSSMNVHLWAIKSSQNCFCHNHVKFSPILIVFWHKDGQDDRIM